jgi:hypothetical protein
MMPFVSTKEIVSRRLVLSSDETKICQVFATLAKDLAGLVGTSSSLPEAVHKGER